MKLVERGPGIPVPPHGLRAPHPFGASGDAIGNDAYWLLNHLSLPISDGADAREVERRDDAALLKALSFITESASVEWEGLTADAATSLKQQATRNLAAGRATIGSDRRPASVDNQIMDFVAGLRELGQDYRDALPFSEPERRWLNDSMTQIIVESDGDCTATRALEIALASDAEIMTAGLRRVVRGRDLIRHWQQWRLQTDEYAGQGSLDAARIALAGIYEYVVPEVDWHARYATDIRVELQAACG